MYLPNTYLRIAVGGVVIIALTLLVGTRDYNGAGVDVIVAALEKGKAHPEAFALKMLFTAITINTGFKGGEIVRPSLSEQLSAVQPQAFWGLTHHSVRL